MSQREQSDKHCDTLTEAAIIENQRWLRDSLPPKFYDFYDKLVATAMRATPSTAFNNPPWGFNGAQPGERYPHIYLVDLIARYGSCRADAARSTDVPNIHEAESDAVTTMREIEERLKALITMTPSSTSARCPACEREWNEQTQAEPGKYEIPITDQGYIGRVPDKCDRIIWRERYYMLPLAPSATASGTISIPRDQLVEWALWLKGRREVSGQVSVDSIETAILELLSRDDISREGKS